MIHDTESAPIPHHYTEVHKLSQSHCGDNQEAGGHIVFIMIIYMCYAYLSSVTFGHSAYIYISIYNARQKGVSQIILTDHSNRSLSMFMRRTQREKNRARR